MSLSQPDPTAPTGNGRWLLWVAVVILFVLAALTFLNLGRLELGPWRGTAIHTDELYFAACAARGLATGDIPIAGCHDNKAPLIFLVHQLVQRGAAGDSLLAIKAAALGVVAAITLLVALTAFRLAGLMAAVVSAALILLCLTTDAQWLALKTETVGSVFMLVGLNCLIGRHRRAWSWLGSGVFLGLAVATKQTYVFAAFAIVIWGWFATPGGAFTGRLRSFLGNMLGFGFGLVLPSAAFLAVFFLQGRHIEYLASLFLYPTIYGDGLAASWIKVVAWKLGNISASLGMVPVLVVLLAAAMAGSLRNWDRARTEDGPRLQGRHLVVIMAVALLLSVFISPVHAPYHDVPPWILMAILGGIVVGDLAEMSRSAPPRAAGFLAAGLVTVALLGAASTWSSNGGRGKTVDLNRAAAFLQAGRGRYAYVLGTWPAFYVYNDLIPASGVLFPWALPGVPANWAYNPPDPNSARGRALAWIQAANLGQLFEDFRRTPPEFIVVSHGMARAAGSNRVSDVPGFDAYLQDHCVAAGPAPDYLGSAQSLYECSVSPANGSASPEQAGAR